MSFALPGIHTPSLVADQRPHVGRVHAGDPEFHRIQSLARICDEADDADPTPTPAGRYAAKASATTLRDRIADAMDAQLGRAVAAEGNAAAITSESSAPALAGGPGPQTRLAQASMRNMRGARAARDRESLLEQIADALEQQGNSTFSLGGS